MDINELLVNLRAEVSKLGAMIRKINEQINDIEAFCKEQGFIKEKQIQKRIKR